MPFSEGEGADGLILLQLCWVCKIWIPSAPLELWPPRLKDLFSLWSTAKAPSYMITTSNISFYYPFLSLWITMPSPVIPHALRKESHLARKDSEWTSDLPPHSPRSVWQSKTTFWKSCKVKQNVTFHHQIWGIVCGECYPWLLTPYHPCHHFSIIL